MYEHRSRKLIYDSAGVVVPVALVGLGIAVHQPPVPEPEGDVAADVEDLLTGLAAHVGTVDEAGRPVVVDDATDELLHLRLQLHVVDLAKAISPATAVDPASCLQLVIDVHPRRVRM